MSDLFMHPPPNSRHALISVMMLGLFTSACSSLPEVRHINIVVFGTEFAQTMESTFDEDLRYSVEITKEKWATRPWTKKVKEWVGRRFEYWL